MHRVRIIRGWGRGRRGGGEKKCRRKERRATKAGQTRHAPSPPRAGGVQTEVTRSTFQRVYFALRTPGVVPSLPSPSSPGSSCPLPAFNPPFLSWGAGTGVNQHTRAGAGAAKESSSSLQAGSPWLHSAGSCPRGSHPKSFRVPWVPALLPQGQGCPRSCRGESQRFGSGVCPARAVLRMSRADVPGSSCPMGLLLWFASLQPSGIPPP